MGIRGRTSAASLSVVSSIDALRRPEPLEELTSEEAHEWRAIVSRLPADWFPRETLGMLAQYCRHIVAARRVTEMIRTLEVGLSVQSEAAKAEGQSQVALMLSASKAFDRLLKMQERESRAISSLATRMRISQQASYDKKRTKPTAPEIRPWD